MKYKLITGLAILTNSILVSQINFTQSLTACYSLNGNANDQINNLTGTLSAVTSTVDRFNTPSSALAFNGSAASFIQLPNNPLLKPTNAFSFSGWIKTNVLNDQYLLMTRNVATSNFEAYDLHFGSVSGGLRIRVKKGDGLANATIITGTTSLSLNTWYHFVLTVDNNTMNVYTNGVLDGSAAITFPFNYLSNKNIILGGSNEISFNLPFNGSMDNLLFFNRILSPTEVSMIYTSDPNCGTLTSIISNDASVTELSVYPNPSAGKFTFKSNETVLEVNIYNIVGELVLNTKDRSEIDLSSMPSGVYYARFNINGNVITKKIMKD